MTLGDGVSGPFFKNAPLTPSPRLISIEGIDFCMTALFVIIFIDQWEKADTHFPALAGLAIGIICLLIFGENQFMLPALIIVSMLLVLYNARKKGSAV